MYAVQWTCGINFGHVSADNAFFGANSTARKERIAAKKERRFSWDGVIASRFRITSLVGEHRLARHPVDPSYPRLLFLSRLDTLPSRAAPQGMP